MKFLVVLALAAAVSAAPPAVSYSTSTPESSVQFSSSSTSSGSSRYAAGPSFKYSASSELQQAPGAISYATATPIHAIHLHELPAAQTHYSELTSAPAFHISQSPVTALQYSHAPQTILSHAAPAEIHLVQTPAIGALQYNPSIAYASHSSSQATPLSFSALIPSGSVNSAKLTANQQYSNSYSLAPAVNTIQYSSSPIASPALALSTLKSNVGKYSDATQVSSSSVSNSVGQSAAPSLKISSAPALKFSAIPATSSPKLTQTFSPAYSAQYTSSYTASAPQYQPIAAPLPSFSSNLGKFSDATQVSSSSVSSSVGQSAAPSLKISSAPLLKFSTISASSAPKFTQTLTPAYGAQYSSYAASAPRYQSIAAQPSFASNLGKYSDASAVSSYSASNLVGQSSNLGKSSLSSASFSPALKVASAPAYASSLLTSAGTQYTSAPAFASSQLSSAGTQYSSAPAFTTKTTSYASPASIGASGLSAYYSQPSYGSSLSSAPSFKLSSPASSVKYSGLNYNNAGFASAYKAGGLQSSGQYSSSGSQHAAGSSYQSALRPALILRQSNQINEDGTFAYDFASDDGITIESNGLVKPLGPEDSAQTSRGTYSYTSPDGTPITTNWWADETGFHVQGEHIPQSIASL